MPVGGKTDARPRGRRREDGRRRPTRIPGPPFRPDGEGGSPPEAPEHLRLLRAVGRRAPGGRGRAGPLHHVFPRDPPGILLPGGAPSPGRPRIDGTGKRSFPPRGPFFGFPSSRRG